MQALTALVSFNWFAIVSSRELKGNLVMRGIDCEIIVMEFHMDHIHIRLANIYCEYCVVVPLGQSSLLISQTDPELSTIRI